MAQSVGHLTRTAEVLVSIPGPPHTFVSPSADSRDAVVSYWRKYVLDGSRFWDCLGRTELVLEQNFVGRI